MRADGTKRAAVISLLLAFCASLTGCADAGDRPPQDAAAGEAEEQSADREEMTAETAEDKEDDMQKDLGAMTPQEALEYMKQAEALVIVDVAATRWYREKTFEGAVNIPIEELSAEEEDALYRDIPSDRPVLLHCRRGMIVPSAYRRIKELRPDIPEISYIAGSPLFDEYNEWLGETR